jgi:hypothetical protein
MNEKYRKQLEKERMDIIDPLTRKYKLSLDEIGALATIKTITLKKLVDKLCEVHHKEPDPPKEIILDKVFMKHTADLMYSIAKNVLPPSKKVEANVPYTTQLMGHQIFNLYRKSSALYDKCRDETQEVKQNEGTAQNSNSTQ